MSHIYFLFFSIIETNSVRINKNKYKSGPYFICYLIWSHICLCLLDCGHWAVIFENLSLLCIFVAVCVSLFVLGSFSSKSYGTTLSLIWLIHQLHEHRSLSVFKRKTSSTLGKDTIKIHLTQNTPPLPLLSRLPLYRKWGQGHLSLMHFKVKHLAEAVWWRQWGTRDGVCLWSR